MLSPVLIRKRNNRQSRDERYCLLDRQQGNPILFDILRKQYRNSYYKYRKLISFCQVVRKHGQLFSVDPAYFRKDEKHLLDFSSLAGKKQAYFHQLEVCYFTKSAIFFVKYRRSLPETERRHHSGSVPILVNVELI